MKTSKEIRTEFIEFFKKYDHTFVPSSPVIPIDDPTLLFTNAGMNQFKDVFLGIGSRPYKRAVNSQKCIRVSGKHNDLEEVGHDTYHHTFFEMLGNWSFGDYFKREAIQWAWELLTEVWKLPKDKLWATVFEGDASEQLEPDEEAERLWKEVTDINPSQVLRFGKKDNFWEMGDTGPCGPCSEIHIDLGPERCDRQDDPDHVCRVNGDCARYIELWNLVFIQFNRDENGVLTPLPDRHVDTGMGFERIVAVLQGVASNYDTDLFRPILTHIGQLVGVDYDRANRDQQVAFRVIADHVRMLTFAITDGALPGNEGRGYVLRRILRRAARYARKLNMHEPFIYQLVPTVVEIMGEAFPEVQEKYAHVMEVIRSEEQSFNKTLDRGIEIFESIVARLQVEGKDEIPGEDAFRLYDTYGFPLDLTRIMAEEKGLRVDEAGFQKAMEAQRERARKATRFTLTVTQADEWVTVTPVEKSSIFLGYETLEAESTIVKYTRQGDRLHVVLAETPFYAEAGGQLGDRGKIVGKDFELEVIDTQKEGDEIVHICRAPEALEITDARVWARVDKAWRLPTMYNHTATHLLHAALRRVLGDHVTQAGSLVAPDRLRFDFTHFKKIERQQLEEIEWMVNQKIQEDLPVEVLFTEFEKARKMGAMALFGEKYSDWVRVIVIDDFSKELCGGTHVRHTGQIGTFVITQETSIASGVRRVEALTGPKAVEFVQRSRDVVFDLDQLLNVQTEELPQKIKEILEENRRLEKELQKLRAGQILNRVEDLLAHSQKIGDVKLVVEQFQDQEMDLLKQLGDRIRQKGKNVVGFFINRANGRVNFVCVVTDDLIKQRGLKAGELVKEAARIAGGGGGGRSHLATAGAKQPEKIPEVIQFVKNRLKEVQK
ncbi:MAG: alanine--tRNA ligase [Calditrichaeota bacterium]|nr:alanine--tRNA ligase [Calditrichota bacterium]